MRYLAAILITISLSLPQCRLKFFRYRGAAMDGGTLEYGPMSKVILKSITK
jgi:hypothetical protein